MIDAIVGGKVDEVNESSSMELKLDVLANLLSQPEVEISTVVTI